jgi:hypothetical protein
MFPFTLTFERPLRQNEPVDRTRFFASLTEYIKKNKGRQITVSANKLSFTVGLSGWSWDKFAQIERGEFVLSDTTISFRAYMYRGFIIGLILSTFMAAISGVWAIGLFCFAWLYGANLVIASVKYRRMLKTIAETINQATNEKASANRVFMK